jgi:hypothetical protein
MMLRFCAIKLFLAEVNLKKEFFLFFGPSRVLDLKVKRKIINNLTNTNCTHTKFNVGVKVNTKPLFKSRQIQLKKVRC